MPKAMLLEMADKLSSMADELRSYAGEAEDEAPSEEGGFSAEATKPVDSSKIKMAAMKMRKSLYE